MQTTDHGIPSGMDLNTFNGSKVSAEMANPELHELTLEFAAIGTWDVDLKNRKIRCNQTFENLLGFKEHLEERSLEDFLGQVHPEQRNRLQQEFTMALQEGQTRSCIFKLDDSQREERWLCIKGSAIYDSQGEPVRALGILYDVTEATILARKLKESEFRFRQVSEFLPQLVWTMDGQGVVDYINENWVTVTGLNFQNVKEGKWAEAIHPDDKEAVISKRSAAIEKGEAHEIELRVKSVKDQEYRWYLWRCVPYRDMEGEIQKWFGTLTEIHEQKLAAMRIKDTEDQLKAVVASAPIVLWALDTNLICILAEGTALDHFFMDPDDLVGLPFAYIVGEKSAQFKNAHRALAGEAFIATETLGSRIYESHYTPMRSSQGRIKSIMVVSIDITERRAFEESLIISEAKYRYLFASNPQPMWMFDLETFEFLEVNDAAVERYGYSREEFLNMTLLDIVPEEDRETFKEDVKKRLNFLNLVPKTSRHIKKSGDVIEVDVLAHDVYEGGHKARLILAHDITKHKNLEFTLDTLSTAGLSLSVSLDFNQTLKTLGELTIPKLGEWCTIDLLNEKGQLNRNLFYHKEKNKVGKESDFEPKDIVPLNSTFKRLLATKKPEVLKHRTGEELQVLGQSVFDFSALYDLICVPLITRAEVLGILSVVRDSKKKSVTEEDVQLIAELANRAAFALENAKLYKAAQKASEAKSLFLANISHEMRTPLGIIHGFSELALDEQLSSEERFNFIRTIKRNTEQLTKLINDVLDLSKIEADRIEIESVEFSMANLLSEIKETLSLKAAEKSLRLQFSISERLPEYLISDPTKIRQIFTNVIGNAIKFTEHGQVEVSISPIFNSNRESITVEVFIKDTGIGMTSEQREKLFQPFSQADVSMTRRFGGTGLGLLISKKLAQALGGDLDIYSTDVNKGTVFKLNFQTKLPKAVAPAKNMDRARARGEHVLEGMKVLLVEDALDNQALISRYLKMAGAEVQVANDGAEGVSKALHNGYDAVLMDIQMPIMDGYEALHKLQATHFDIPVIALTAHAMREEREHALQEGFSEYLTKPISRVDLVQVLQDIQRTGRHH